jgi:general secretion pathway protein K
MILIVVLWAVAMMTLIVVGLSAFSQNSISLASVETDRLRSELALEAGLAAGGAIVLSTTPEQRVFLKGLPIVVDIGSGRLAEVRVADASGRIDINRADPALISSLLSRLEIGPGPREALTNAISRLRGPKEDKAQPGSESANNVQDGTAESTPLTPVFFSLAQLQGLEGVDSKVVDKLLPFITLYSSDGKVNPMAAPDIVVEAIPGLSPADRAALTSASQRKQWQIPAVREILDRETKFMAIADSQSFVIDVRLISGPGIIPESRLTASILLDSAGKAPFQVLAWSW